MSGSIAQERMEKAKKNKRNEFFTRLEDVELECQAYDWKDKTVYLNCDDRTSMFWRYFTDNFMELGLKRVIATSIRDTVDSKAMRYDFLGVKGQSRLPLQGNGSFKSPECLKILQDEADVVVTNPPFSIFRNYIKTILDSRKKFLVIAPQLAFGYKEMFLPYVATGKVWTGHSKLNTGMWFKIPVDYKLEGSTNTKLDKDGSLIARVGVATWMTNLEYPGRLDRMRECRVSYADRTWKKYDNYDAIDIPNTLQIPYDYDGVMGVPITFVYYFNPHQFRVVGYRYGDDGKDLSINGKIKYNRILIRHEGAKNVQ